MKIIGNFIYRHIRFVQNAVWVDIVWSKTLQFRLKKLSYPLLKIPNSQLCPYTALVAMVRSNPQQQDKPCFAHVDGKPWTYQQFQRKMRSCLKKAGYKNCKRFSSHSYRRGGCSFSYQSGMDEFMIKIIGDWKSDVYRSYCHVDIDTRTRACQLMRKQIMQLQV